MFGKRKNRRQLVELAVLLTFMFGGVVAVGFAGKNLTWVTQPNSSSRVHSENREPVRPQRTPKEEFAPSAVQSGGQFDITRQLIAGGGNTSSGGALVLSGSIGQAAAGPSLNGGQFSLTSGFWQAEFST